MKKVLMIIVCLLSVMVISAMAYNPAIVDEDTGGTNWDGGTGINGQDIAPTGGWIQGEAGDILYDSGGADYDGDSMAIKYSSGSPRYFYTNHSLNVRNLTLMFYDDSSDTSAYMYIAPGGFEQYEELVGVVTSKSSSHYVYGSPFTTSSVARSTGWHNFTWEYKDSDGLVHTYIDGTKLGTQDLTDFDANRSFNGVHLYMDSTACANCRIDKVHFWNASDAPPPPPTPTSYVDVSFNNTEGETEYTNISIKYGNFNLTTGTNATLTYNGLNYSATNSNL